MSNSKPTVLIVDDEPRFGQICKKALDDEGYETRFAQSGLECLEMARAMRPDVLLLDLMMPNMDGITTLRRLHDLGSAPLVIILTGQGSLESAREAMVLGAYEYVTKPFNLEFLKATVRDGLAASRGTDGGE